MPRPVHHLIDYLRQSESQGQSHVFLDEGARQVLREMHRQNRVKSRRAAPSPPSRKPAKHRETNPTPAASEQPASSQFAILEVPDAPLRSQLNHLARLAKSWKPARELGGFRDKMVFATGNPEAELMLVGEAPGHEEEQKSKPFVGPAGQKLDQILRAMGLSREMVYITNICKFRPAMPDQGTGNRKPTQEEMQVCLPFIHTEIHLVKPKVIVALGGTAAQGLLSTGEGVGKLRGRFHDFQGMPLRVTYHPSYLLRQQSTAAERRKVWEDMLAVMEKLALPISEKQRSYFR